MALERILEYKRGEVARRKEERPFEGFREELTSSDRSFADALLSPHTGFIFEAKKASPSRGLIRANFDPVEIAKAYSGFADAISVLTDEHFFQGGFEVLRAIRENAPQPVLCKDFIIDPWQVYEARLHGADAVLLMLSVLDDETFLACQLAASSWGMDSLVEVHDEAELERAERLGAEIVGINNRNLKTLEVDISTTALLAPKARSFAKAVVCESGIFTHQQVLELRDQVDAFLIGTSLMQRADLNQAIRDIVYGPVKVCGLTNEDDAAAAYSCGASYGGLIFVDESPRLVTPDRAQGLVRSTPLKWVGVFVEEPIERVAALAHDLNLSAVQLHGGENSGYMEDLRSLLPSGCEIWSALRVSAAVPDIEIPGADRVLLDSFHPTLRGGTGQTFDWTGLEGQNLGRAVLSGGLTPDLADSADRLGAGILDVNSGVEEAPGKKHHMKLAQFFSALRGQTRGTSNAA